MVEVKLFAYFRDSCGKSVEVQHYEGLMIVDVIEQLGIAVDDVSIILVNGKHRTLETVLLDGQKLFLFPPVGGG